MDALGDGEAAKSDEQGNKKSRRTRRANKLITLDHAENQGGNNVDDGGDSNGREQRPAYAACKYNRKSYKSYCGLVSYFPARMLEEYKQVNEIFGHEKTEKLLSDAAEKQKSGNGSTEDTVKSLLWEARCWKDDPIGGPHAKYRELLKDNN